jgi:PIN domain nuclease of toxin-antitoxin system
MKLLFDTHAFIWWDSAPANLPASVLTMCQDPANTLLLSVVSAWEMQIKSHLGKLKFASPLGGIIANQRQTNGVEILSITLNHVLTLETLPDHHKDPFDRLLVAQALVEEATLISNDPIIQQYPAKLAW